MILSYCKTCGILIRNPMRNDVHGSETLSDLLCPACTKTERDKVRVDLQRRRLRTSKHQSVTTRTIDTTWKKYTYPLTSFSMLFACLLGYRLVSAQSLRTSCNDDNIQVVQTKRTISTDQQFEKIEPIPERIIATTRELSTEKSIETRGVIATGLAIKVDSETERPQEKMITSTIIRLRVWNDCRVLDRNKDNRICLKEYMDSYSDQSEQGVAYFKAMDLNTNGYIERDEIKSALAKK